MVRVDRSPDRDGDEALPAGVQGGRGRVVPVPAGGDDRAGRRPAEHPGRPATEEDGDSEGRRQQQIDWTSTTGHETALFRATILSKGNFFVCASAAICRRMHYRCICMFEWRWLVK